jgi:pimeloyl-ACP methyl ester carboxylesterase
VRDETLTLPDGRVLAYTEVGSTRRDAPVVVYLHGAPTSRLDLAWADDQLASQGVRVVSPDRPGYGGSSPQLDRTLADHPAEVAALADHLGVDRFAVIGLSGGGPHAMGCAALLPSRVRAVAIVAGVTDFAWPEARDGFDPAEAEIMAQPDEEAAVSWCESHYGIDGLGFLEGDLPAVEAAALGDDPTAIDIAVAEALAQGIAAYARDVWIIGRQWPFDPANITAPLAIFHGDADAIVPLSHSKHTASLVPGAHLTVWRGVPHIGAARKTPEVIAALARRQGSGEP